MLITKMCEILMSERDSLFEIKITISLDFVNCLDPGYTIGELSNAFIQNSQNSKNARFCI
jgi:hypothetical protein